MRVKVALTSLSDALEFVKITSKVSQRIYLVGDNFWVNAKSLFSVIFTIKKEEVWCECAIDISDKISKFVV